MAFRRFEVPNKFLFFCSQINYTKSDFSVYTRRVVAHHKINNETWYFLELTRKLNLKLAGFRLFT